MVIEYSTILVLTLLIEKTKQNNSVMKILYTQTKIGFKIRLLVEIKNIHIYIYTHKVQMSSDIEDAFAAHANLLSTACIPWMRVLQ